MSSATSPLSAARVSLATPTGTGCSIDGLAIYLNDHLGGSTLGVELVQRARDSNEGNEYGEELSGLAEEISEDRDALLQILEELEIRRDLFKVTGGWIAEKLGRLKLNGSLLEYSPLSRLIEIEGLYLGVTGKLALWTNLKAARGDRIKSVDLDDLVARAESQRSRLEDLRTRAAAEALTTNETPPNP
ncbi:MAG: hypothetical protein H0V25_07890 [Solirubrobacterales bacterium]|nr:hypothetical protein [Solirubrobacterales bacterium]